MAAPKLSIIVPVRDDERLFRLLTSLSDSPELQSCELIVACNGNHARDFDGSVLIIHGDTHTQRVDHPLTNSRGRPYKNFTRLETFGSPDIGWLRVVVDAQEGKILECDPRLAQD